MSVNVTVVTTANRTCRFSLDTPQGMLACAMPCSAAPTFFPENR